MSEEQSGGDWIIVSKFRQSGDRAYWGTPKHPTSAWDSRLTPYRGSAHRYTSEQAAREMAERLVKGRSLSEYELEQLPAKPPLT